MTVLVGWAPILAPWCGDTLRVIEPFVPEAQFADIMRYRRWEDRQARLLARLILREILRRQGVAMTLDDIETTREGRPFLRGDGDFSIAHSKTLALCAWVPHGRVGIDVETLQCSLTIEDLWSWMSDGERRSIDASPAPMDEALQFWTAKEAVCKADGCGIAAGDLPDCASPDVVFRGNLWRVRSIRKRGQVVSLAQAADVPGPVRIFRLRVEDQTIIA